MRTMLESEEYARRACVTCNRKKRRCDRKLPSCGLCCSKAFICTYPSPKVSKNHGQGRSILGHHCAQEYNVSSSDALPTDGNSTIHNESAQSIASLPRTFIDARCLTGDYSAKVAISLKYFETVHVFLPIVSRPDFLRCVSNVAGVVPAHTELLLVCMELICISPIVGRRMDSLQKYVHAKRLYAEIEGDDDLHIQVLQAGILIALYEFGHAIYPSVHYTIAASLRYQIQLDTGESASLPSHWVCEEERQRARWALFVLDRCIGLGQPGRTAIIPGPEPSYFLPVHEEVWDSDIQPKQHTREVVSSLNATAGRYARLVQSVYLLDRVVNHISDQLMDSRISSSLKTRVVDTAKALVELIRSDNLSTDPDASTATAICYCSLLLMRTTFRANTEVHDLLPGPTVQEIAIEAAKMAAQLLSIATPLLESVSPFLLHFCYHAYDTLTSSPPVADVERRANIDKIGKAATVAKLIAFLSSRWALGDVYLDLVQTRDLG